MDRVVAQQVGVGLDRAEVVDRDDLDVGAARLDDRPQHVAPDPAETVDCHLDRHVTPYVPCARVSVRRTASRQPAYRLLAPSRVHRRLEAAVERPGARELGRARIQAGAHPRKPGGAERGGLQHLRAVDRGAEDVGEALEHPVVGGHAAVDAEHGVAGVRPVGAHRLDEVAGLVGDALERGAGEFGRAGVAGEAEDGAAGVGVPVGRAEAGEGGDEVEPLAGVGGLGEGLGLGGVADDLQPVAQPLDDGAGDEDRAFERVGRAAVELVGDGGEQPVAAGDRACRRC